MHYSAKTSNCFKRKKELPKQPLSDWGHPDPKFKHVKLTTISDNATV